MSSYNSHDCSHQPFNMICFTHYSANAGNSWCLLSADTERVLKSASLDFSINDFPGSQIRCHSTACTPATMRLVKTTSLQQTASSWRKNFWRDLTPLSQYHLNPRLISRLNWNLNAIKASVPKLLSCLGAVLAKKPKHFSIFRPFFSLQHWRV